MDSIGRKVYDIYYDRANGFVVMKWSGYSTSAQFREGTELMLQILTENKVNKVLADIKNMTIIGLEDQKWLELEFLPKAIANGFEAIALVKPSNYFNAVVIQELLSKAVLSVLQMRVFDDAEQAGLWLKTITY